MPVCIGMFEPSAALHLVRIAKLPNQEREGSRSYVIAFVIPLGMQQCFSCVVLCCVVLWMRTQFSGRTSHPWSINLFVENGDDGRGKVGREEHYTWTYLGWIVAKRGWWKVLLIACPLFCVGCCKVILWRQGR